MKGGKEDLKRLRALVACGKLTEKEHDAFRDMLRRIETRQCDALTKAQREFVTIVYDRHDLDVEEPLNLHSSGKLVDGDNGVDLDVILTHVPPHLRKPLSPPGRARRE